MLECVANVSEGRRDDVLAALQAATAPSLLDTHVDADHGRSVFTLAGPGPRDADAAARRLARAIATGPFDLAAHAGVHPRLGALDVVPFVALDEPRAVARDAAVEYGSWIAREHGVPVFFYDDADPEGRTLPSVRRDAFTTRPADVGPGTPHPRLGAVAVGARPPLVAVNCELDRDDLALAREIATSVRERDGGLVGVRALGFALESRRRVEVSMNLVDLAATGLEEACDEVRRRAREHRADVARIELVGLLPAAELERCSVAFRSWSGVGPERTIEAAMVRVARGDGSGAAAAL